MVGSMVPLHPAKTMLVSALRIRTPGTLFAFVVSLLVLSQFGVAQDKLLPVIHADHLTSAVLPSNQIRSRIARDRQGFVWIGTLEGLARFDGHACKVFRNAASDPHSLPGNIVNGLHVDRKDRLWVACWGVGLSLFDAQHERFIHFRSRPNDTAWVQTKSIAEIIEDREGNLWLGSLDGEIVFVDMSAARTESDVDSVARRVRFRSFVHPGFGSFIYGIEEWDEHSVLVSSNGGLFIVDRATGRISRPRFPPVSGVRIDTVMTTGICWENAERLWVGTAFHGLCLFNRTNGSVTVYHKRPQRGNQLRDDRMTDVQLDRSGMLWVGTLEGIDLFDPSAGAYKEYLTMTGAQARSMYTRFSIDASGILWVSTYDRGVFFLHPRSFRLPHYALRGSTGRPVPMEMIDEWRDGSLWITGAGKVFKVDVDDLEVLQTADIYKGEKILYGRAIADSYSDGKKRIWYGTFGVGLYSFEPASGRVRNFRPRLEADRSKQKLYACQGVAPARGDSLWVAVEYDGLYRFDPRTEVFSKVLDCWAYRLMKDSRGIVWVSDDQVGLRLLDPTTNAIEIHRHDEKNPASVSGNKVVKTMEDSRGRMWVGAATLDLWEPEARSFKHFPNPGVREGMISEPIGDDARGRIWVSYLFDVLGILDPTTGKYLNYDYSDGACGMTVPGDMHRLRDGRVVLTGYAGLNIVHPDSLAGPGLPPPFVLTRLTINDSTSISPQRIAGASLFPLSSSQNVLEFEFALIDPGATHLVEYLYRLEGLEATWLNWNERRFVRYPGLSPGDYVFRVKAVNKHGDWPDQEIAFALSIAPPWWQTWWFRGFGLAVFAGALYAVYRIRLARVLALERLRLRIADDIHDDIGSELSGVALQTDMIARLLPPESPVHARLADASQRIRSVGEDLRDVVWIVNPELDSVPDLMARMKSIAGTMLAGHRYTFEAPGDSSSLSLGLEFKRHVLMMFKEMLNNVVRHARATAVQIEVTRKDGRLRVCVVDNGVGFDASVKMEGRGLTSLRNRAAAVGGMLSVESGPGSGTRVCFEADITRSGD